MNFHSTGCDKSTNNGSADTHTDDPGSEDNPKGCIEPKERLCDVHLSHGMMKQFSKHHFWGARNHCFTKISVDRFRLWANPHKSQSSPGICLVRPAAPYLPGSQEDPKGTFHLPVLPHTACVGLPWGKPTQRWKSHGFPFGQWSTNDGFSTSMLVYRTVIPVHPFPLFIHKGYQKPIGRFPASMYYYYTCIHIHMYGYNMQQHENPEQSKQHQAT